MPELFSAPVARTNRYSLLGRLERVMDGGSTESPCASVAPPEATRSVWPAATVNSLKRAAFTLIALVKLMVTVPPDASSAVAFTTQTQTVEAALAALSA